MDIWSWNNAVDAEGTMLSSGTGDAGELVLGNLRDPRPGKIWRAGDMPATLDIQLPLIAGISVVGIFNCNFAGLTSMAVQLASPTGPGWETEIDLGELGASRQAVFVLRDAAGLAPVGADHASIVADGEPLEIGRVWLGGADWQPSRSHGYEGSAWGYEDLSTRSRTPRSGSFLMDRGARLRTFTASYPALGPDDYLGTLNAMDDRGLAQQMLFVPSPDAYDPHRFAVLGYLGEMPSTAWRTLMLAERTITIQEAG